MSGGPVFCEHEDRLYLFGVYTGIVYPDAAEGVSPEWTTALARLESLIRRPSVIRGSAYMVGRGNGGELPEMQNAKTAIFLFVSQLTLHLCRFDSHPHHAMSRTH
jgi:hypothetical protein